MRIESDGSSIPHAKKAEGRMLYEVASTMGIKQLIEEPTRGKHILDLFLTYFTDSAASTLAAVADHRGVITNIKFKVTTTSTHQRDVSHFKDADWVRCPATSNTRIRISLYFQHRPSEPS